MVIPEIDFSFYLQALNQKYSRWRNDYTFTDVTHEVPNSDLPGQNSTQTKLKKGLGSPLGFELVVEFIEESNQEEDQENQKPPKKKVEPLEVLEGLRKYAQDHVILVGRPGSGKSTALDCC